MFLTTITSRQQGPRHYHHALTSLPLEPSIHRIATTRWWNSSPLWLRCYCLLYSWKQNETSIALGVRTREGRAPIPREDSRNKAKKVAILRLTRSRYHYALMRSPRLRPRWSHSPSSHLTLELELPSLASKPSCFFWFERHVIPDGSGEIKRTKQRKRDT